MILIESEIFIILLAVICEELIFGFFISKWGRKLIFWIINNLTWQDFIIWIMPPFWFVAHVFVYGFTIENILWSGFLALNLHVFSLWFVLNEARNHYEKHIFPRLRKRLKESTIRVTEPHYFNLREWMLCNQ